LSLPRALEDYVRRRVRFVVGRFGPKLEHVTVRIADVNGPKGGADKLCRVEARLGGRSPLVAEDTAADLRQAVDRAVDRIGRVIGRAVARRRDTPRGLPVAPRS
jgi:ribosome-associated translation inhibitor RaiA